MPITLAIDQRYLPAETYRGTALTVAQLRDLRKRREYGESLSDLSRLFGISASYAGRLCRKVDQPRPSGGTKSGA